MKKYGFSTLLISITLFGIYALYAAHQVFIVFTIGFAIAYFLQKFAKILQDKTTLSYKASATIIFTTFFLFIANILIYLLPQIYYQVYNFIVKFPTYKVNFINTISYYLDKFSINISNEYIQKLNEPLKDYIDNGIGIIFTIFHDFFMSLISAIDVIILSGIIPIIVLYIMYDWELITKKASRAIGYGIAALQNVLATEVINLHENSKLSAKFITSTAKEILNIIATYFSSLAIVCLILTIYYIVALTILGFDMPIILGIVSGFSIMLPFIGPILSIMLLLSISLFVKGVSIQLLYVILTVSIAQAVEGSFLTPKIVGEKLGLHPVVIIFMVFLFGKLFGLIGVIIASPTTAIIKLFLKKLINT